jgi:ATPase subunit of ABC transporter with duplicated ATPase domains
MSSQKLVAARDISFTYDSSTEPLFADVSAHFPVGFTGIIGANGVGKTTLLRVLIGQLTPQTGAIEGVEDAVYCEQRTDNPPATFSDFLADWSGEAFDLRGRLDVDFDYLERWNSLSHGERKRAQIGHALWQAPSLLAIDEPTNHIDARARELLLASLERYRGIGLIVSHDRELLDDLCVQSIWLDPPRARAFSGGYSAAREERQLEKEGAVRDRKKAATQAKRLQREMVKRREQASAEHKIRSKRGLSRKDSDTRHKIDMARVADGGAGSTLRQLEGRSARALERLESTRVEKEYETGIWLPGSRSQRSWILRMDAGEFEFGDKQRLEWPQVSVGPEDRIAITGVNGAGKSTFLRHTLPQLNVPPDKAIELPQEVSAELAQSVLDEARALPKAQLGHIMNVVSRLNSRPERLLRSRQPSPGEIRKLLLAIGMSRSPHVIVMDEPTNHLDLPSIEALENALADCPCALLLVSHDKRFIDAVGAHRWSIEVDDRGNSNLTID